ncbi:MAG: glutamine--fructose-6-phosphate transaminase (isomerizing) [Planctomycetota bacterium]|nr:glutamine--fructose-6-phosphate transaminase (isomerizing) [Planctomycetota bacterium]
MCGVVGAIQRGGGVVETLLQGLRLLEYRGYDSAGVAVLEAGAISIRRKAGRLERLEHSLSDGTLSGARAGIGHTRWATHGPPSDENAHPHTDAEGRVALVHNGVIENWAELRAELEAAGVRFASDTDTEVLAHLVGREVARGRELPDAVRASLARVRGYYAIAALAQGERGPRIVCARSGPPLAVAAGPDGVYLASDVLALIAHTRDVVFLEDGDVCELELGRPLRVTRIDGTVVDRPTRRVEWDPESAGKGSFPHYMLKEIHEQPDVLARTAFDRLRLDKGDVDFGVPGFGDHELRAIDRIQVVACGTALHAGWIARYLIEGLARIPVDVDYASEFRYRDPVLAHNTLALAISQSGETADTLAALRLAKTLGARTAAICNVVGSTLVRESQATILTHAGPEIGVASTKAFVAQVVAAFLFAVRLGRARGVLSLAQGKELVSELRLLRPKMESLLGERAVSEVRDIAQKNRSQRGFLFLGRGINYPIALEGALKLKEISYVHAEGYPAGEMKHGPIALIDPEMSILVVNSAGPLAEKVRSNLEQVRARGGHVIAIGSDRESIAQSDEHVLVPECSEWLSPILNVIPLQLVAYHMADLKGLDIDKPRNLAKSVTVE